jgi:hypothetical protein
MSVLRCVACSPLPFKRAVAKAHEKPVIGTMQLLAAAPTKVDSCAAPADVAMKQRRKQFQDEVERLRRCLQKLTVQQPDALETRVATLQRTIGQQSARDKRGAKADAAAAAAAAAAALKQEELYGGGNIEVDGMRAGSGMLLLLDPVFEFHMRTHSLLQSNVTPLLLLHVQQRCNVALCRGGQDEMAALAQDYLERATLLSKLTMFGGHEAAVGAAASGKEVVVLKMQELLACAQMQAGDLQLLLSLNAAYFLEYAPMVAALLSLMVERLQRCVRVQDVLDMWPQLVQQCSDRFVDFLLDPGYGVSDSELVPSPPAPAPPSVSADSGEESCDSNEETNRTSCCPDDSAAMHLRDLHVDFSEHTPDQQQQQQQPKFTHPHFLCSVSLLSTEQRKVLLAARSLMTRAGIAWQLQQELMYGVMEQMGRHIDVHTRHVELSNGRRLASATRHQYFP